MDVPAGSTVAVQGLGGLGHLAIQYAAKLGYRVVAVSRGSDKEAFARGLGAREYVDSEKVDPGEALQALGGAALVITTKPSPEGMGDLMAGLGVRRKLLILSGKTCPIAPTSACGCLLTIAIVPGEVPANTAVMVRSSPPFSPSSCSSPKERR